MRRERKGFEGGKKKFEANSDADKKKFEEMFDKIKVHQDRLEILVDEDTKSFGVFMDAMKLPKETDEEKAYRKAQMEEATKVIIKVPYEIATESLEVLKSLETIIEFGNKNAITDVGVAALLLNAGVEGAVLNVKINLPGLSDESLVSDYNIKCDVMVKEANELKEKYLTIVNSNI